MKFQIQESIAASFSYHVLCAEQSIKRILKMLHSREDRYKEIATGTPDVGLSQLYQGRSSL